MSPQPPATFAEHMRMVGWFTQDWDKQQAKLSREEAQHVRASVQVALRAVEEQPRLIRERDLAVRHATNGVYYTRRLREKLERQERLIRDLRAENRALRAEGEVS